METLNLSGLPFSSRMTSTQDETAHDHSYFECFFITNGKILHRIENTEVELSTGDAVLIAPGIQHSFKHIGECTHRDNMIEVKMFESCCNFLDPNCFQRFIKEKYVSFHLTQEYMLLFKSHIIYFLSIYDIPQRRNYEKFLIIFLLSALLFPNEENFVSVNNFKQQVLACVSTHFMKKNAITLICEEMNFNQSYLCKKFLNTCGCTLTEYINDLRIKHAAYLLSMTQYTLPRICDEIGIESLPYFNKLFKEHYNTTPAKYRKEHLGGSPLALLKNS